MPNQKSRICISVKMFAAAKKRKTINKFFKCMMSPSVKVIKTDFVDFKGGGRTLIGWLSISLG
jgi:hypothetical protein